MKVLYIVDRFPVFSETFIADEILDHVQAGLDVEVAVLQDEHAGDFPPHDSPLADKVNLRFLGSNAGSLVDNLRFIAKIAIACPEFRRHYRALWQKGLSIREIALGAAIARDFTNADIIHCHYGFIGRVGLAAAEMITPRPQVFVTFHAHDLTKKWYLPLEKYYRPLFDSLAVLLPISKYWEKELLRAGANENRTIVHHVGVELAEPVDVPASESLRLLMIGRFVEKKGHRYAVDALAELSRRRVPFQCTMIGGGPLLHAIEAQIESAGLTESIVLTGPIKHAKTLSHLDEADILLMPSVTAPSGDKEGIPVALMEGMARGIPVISTYHSGIPELIENSRSGFLVPERDVEGLANKIEELVANIDLRRGLGLAGRERVNADFNRSKLGGALRGYYRTVGYAQPHPDQSRKPA